jgi:alpha-ketoglutaric semialdehyde dehydrogenase
MTLALYCRNYIDGRWRDSRSARTYPVFNPADLRQTIHRYPLSTAAEVAEAVESAATAYIGWCRTSLAERSNILRNVVGLIRGQRPDIARLITRENGKLIAESLAEIDAAILELEYQIGEGERQFGRASDCYRPHMMTYSRKQPLGVVSIIVPWNFPFNVPWRKLVPALMAGNTAILKPASQTPGVGEVVVRLLIEAGMPPGVVQFVTGSGSELSDVLVEHPLIRAITFTGSTAVGRRIAQRAAARFTRAQLEMGGKNAMVVLRDADITLAGKDAAIAAFSCAGQWCTSTSRLIVETAVAEELMDVLLERISALKVGPGDRAESEMGPVAGKGQLDGVLEHIERARRQGAHFAAGGRRCEEGDLSHGCFVAPSVIDHAHEGLDAAREEIFGPVLAAFRVADYPSALRLANAVPYGLSSSVYTRDLERAIHFAEHSEVGLTHVNTHSAYKEPQQGFGGIKESGFGLSEAGSTGIQFFQDEKAIYISKGIEIRPLIHAANGGFI